MRGVAKTRSGAYGALSLLLLHIGGAAQAQAQESEAEKAFEIINREAKDKDVFVFDFAVPSSPGLTLLGVDKDKITQSNSLKPFVLSLPGILASDGEGRAVALDGSIGSLLIPDSEQRYSDYQANALIYRTRFNAGLYEGVDDDDATKDKASRVAIGVSSSLLNSSDPLLATVPGGSSPAYISCLNSIKRDLFPKPTFDADADAAAIAAFKKDNKLSTLIPTCMEVADLAARLGTDVDVGGGVLFEGDPGELSDLREEVGVLWASFRTSFGSRGPDTEDGTTFAEYKDWADNFGRWLMIGGAGRAALKESVATGDATTPQIRADTFNLWAGLESHSKTNRFAVQIGREKIEPSDAAQSAFGGTRTVYNASFDQSLGESNLWLSLSYGKAEGTGFLKSDSTARVTITFNAPTAKKIFGGS